MIEADDPICGSAALLLRFPGKDIINESKARYSCIRDLISWRILQEPSASVCSCPVNWLRWTHIFDQAATVDIREVPVHGLRVDR